jgi:hypothetical protein
MLTRSTERIRCQENARLIFVSELLAFWILSIVRYSKNLENTAFDLFPSSELCLRLALSKGPNRVNVSPSPEDGNRSSFRNVVFYNFLEYRKMDKVQKSSNS